MNCQIKRFARVFELSPREGIILAQAWALFFLVDLGLKSLPFKHLLALCQKWPLRNGRDVAPVPSPSLTRVVWLVEVAGRYTPVNGTCLKKALVLSWILGRRGIATTLRIGVARHEGTSLTAHAWLERGGEALLGQAEVECHEPLARAWEQRLAGSGGGGA